MRIFVTQYTSCIDPFLCINKNHYLIDRGWGEDKDTEIKKEFYRAGRIIHTGIIHTTKCQSGVLIDSAQKLIRPKCLYKYIQVLNS